jgi:hypothetical protein
MALQTIDNGEQNLNIRTALNGMFAELYTSVVAAGGNNSAKVTLSNGASKSTIRSNLNTMFSDLYTQVTSLGGSPSGHVTLANGEALPSFRSDINTMFSELYTAAAGLSGGAGNFLSIFGSDLVAWYDSSDASTFTLGSEIIGGSGFYPVVQWNDKSGNDYHLYNAVTDKPVYSANNLGSGHPSVEFKAGAGLGTIMVTVDNTVAAGFGQYTVFAVLRLNTSSGQYGCPFLFDQNIASDPSTSNLSTMLTRNNSGAGLLGVRNGVRAAKAISYDTTVRVANVWHTTTNEMFINNVGSGTDSATLGNLDTVGTIALGGHAIWSGYCFLGHICEVAFVGVAADSTQLGDVETMLAAKWTA